MLSFSSGKLNNMITTDVDKARRATWILERLMFFFFQFCSLYRIHNFKLWQWVYLLLWFKKNLNTMDSFQLCFASLRIHQPLCALEALRQIHVLLLTVPLLDKICAENSVKKQNEPSTSRGTFAGGDLYCCIAFIDGGFGLHRFELDGFCDLERFKPHVSHGKLCSVSKFSCFLDMILKDDADGSWWRVTW